MFKKGSKIYSIFNNKCPKCNEGNFFEDNNPLHLKKAMKMGSHCTNCGFKYEIEPSFFYGAMYVNYGLTVGISIVTFLITTLVFKLSLIDSFLPIVAVLLLTAPFSIRLSRIIWINLFVKYDSNYPKTTKIDQ